MSRLLFQCALALGCAACVADAGVGRKPPNIFMLADGECRLQPSSRSFPFVGPPRAQPDSPHFYRSCCLCMSPVACVQISDPCAFIDLGFFNVGYQQKQFGGTAEPRRLSTRWPIRGWCLTACTRISTVALRALPFCQAAFPYTSRRTTETTWWRILVERICACPCSRKSLRRSTITILSLASGTLAHDPRKISQSTEVSTHTLAFSKVARITSTSTRVMIILCLLTSGETGHQRTGRTAPFLPSCTRERPKESSASMPPRGKQAAVHVLGVAGSTHTSRDPGLIHAKVCAQ